MSRRRRCGGEKRGVGDYLLRFFLFFSLIPRRLDRRRSCLMWVIKACWPGDVDECDVGTVEEGLFPWRNPTRKSRELEDEGCRFVVLL